MRDLLETRCCLYCKSKISQKQPQHWFYHGVTDDAPLSPWPQLILNCTVRSEFCLPVLTLICKEQKLTGVRNISSQNTEYTWLQNVSSILLLVYACTSLNYSHLNHATEYKRTLISYLIKKAIITIWWCKFHQNHAIIYEHLDVDASFMHSLKRRVKQFLSSLL